MSQLLSFVQAFSEVLMLIPMFLLVMMKFFVLLKMFLGRIKAVRSGSIHANYFKVFEQREGTTIPDDLVQVSRHFTNLNEMPYLYYTVLLFYIVVGSISVSTVVLSWLYFIFRFIHTRIHLTYNNVLHRLIAFGLSCVVLFLMWILLIFSVIL
jgi:hypothetical protein